jgi:acyl-[acyl carrier protein]--UDP-N-acetylglucosamine O-acyltransferase
MNMTLSDDDRYAGINPTELHRETIIKNNITYEKVKYKIIAIKEKPYKRLMKEYKEKYGQNDFNIATHFEERNKNSIEIESIYWFNITNLN